MAITAEQIIAKAFHTLGVYVPGDTISQTDMSSAVETFDWMLEDWASNEQLTVFAVTQESFALAQGKNEYTIGTGGELNTFRPEEVIGAFIRISNNDHRVYPIIREKYTEIVAKTSQGRPYLFYYDPQYPLANLFLYPTPNASDTIFLDMLKPFTEITVETDTLSFPKSYNLAFVFNLALELGLTYEVDAGKYDRISKRAKELKRKIKNKNFTVPLLKSDFLESQGRSNLNGPNGYLYS